jgi:hypothetical protein
VWELTRKPTSRYAAVVLKPCVNVALGDDDDDGDIGSCECRLAQWSVAEGERERGSEG